MEPSPHLPEHARKLLDTLKRRCPMRHQTVETGKETLTIWTACDVDPLLEELSHRPQDDPDVTDERMPYWAEIWPSAVSLAVTILERRESLPPEPWLELGCGTGLAGVAAARAGRRGLCTDYMREALWLAELNACENRAAEQMDFRRLDWREPPADLQVPWILAADIAYEDRNFQPLIDCFNRVLSPGGEIWLSEPGRAIAKPFFSALETTGWVVEPLRHDPPVTIHRLRRVTGG